MASEDGEHPSLVCSRCRGKLELPGDLEASAVACPYCDQENVLPRSLVASRSARAKAARDERKAQERAAQRVDERKTRRRGRVIGAIVAVIVTALVGLTILVLFWMFRDNRSTDPAYTGQTQIMQSLAALQAQGCVHVVSPPEVTEGHTRWTMTMKKGGSCLVALASTGVRDNILTLQLRTPQKRSVPAPPPSNFVQLVHCASETGDHALDISSSTDYFYTYAVVDCPRSLYEKPRAEDPVSTGLSAVTERMKQLNADGCTHVVYPAERGDVPFEWNANFADSKNANCLHILGYTGVSANILTVTLTTPFGESVPTSPPGNAIDFRYCGQTGGPHKLKFVPKTNDYYTFAAVDCPRVSKKKKKRR